ncbi:helix-turn-helix domain-containing protein [Pseudonocardia sp. NPDC046786]|uniref:sigma-54-dependent Fis family transcriptional regulator n=1 Tax=Pseudonocardia sp. NPDC046786 TaxID=3155471 RepID=UPI00340B6C74
MGDLVRRRRLLDAARSALLERPDADLPDVPRHVVASWRRSAARGVDPGVIANQYHPDLDVQSRLVRCARPVVERLAEQVADIPVCIALTDDRARLLVRRDTTSRIGRDADVHNFAERFGYAEDAVGTNGVGTVLESGDSVHIVGAEHFVERLHDYACAGAPVHDPFSGRIEGVIDISCRAEHSSPVLHSLVRSAAARIRDHLLRDRDPDQQALFDLYTRVDARTRRAVLAVGRRTVLANAEMRTLLEPGDLVALQDHARFLMIGGPGVDDRIDLPSGARVRLRGSTVSVGGTVAGLAGEVAVLREAGGLPAPRAAGDDRAAIAAGSVRSPALRAARAVVAEALRTGVPVLVVGEPGSGRRRLLADLDRALRSPDGTAGTAGPAATAGPADTTGTPGGGSAPLVVLHDIDRLDDDGARRALALLDRPGARFAATATTATTAAATTTAPTAPTAPTAAATTPTAATTTAAAVATAAATAAATATAAAAAAPTTATTAAATAATAATATGAGAAPRGPSHDALLARFRQSVTVPPLRSRLGDLPALVGELLAELAPGRDVRPSPDALRTLARYDWPGNVRELRAALEAALGRRPVGELTAADLPEFCQSAPRTALRPVDQAERDAIVAALRDSGGNRVAAAAALGLARSTLYRKIAQYRISG